MLHQQVDHALVARIERVVAGALAAPVDRVPRRACVEDKVAQAPVRQAPLSGRARLRLPAGSRSAVLAALDGHTSGLVLTGPHA